MRTEEQRKKRKELKRQAYGLVDTFTPKSADSKIIIRVNFFDPTKGQLPVDHIAQTIARFSSTKKPKHSHFRSRIK